MAVKFLVLLDVLFHRLERWLLEHAADVAWWLLRPLERKGLVEHVYPKRMELKRDLLCLKKATYDLTFRDAKYEPHLGSWGLLGFSLVDLD